MSEHDSQRAAEIARGLTVEERSLFRAMVDADKYDSGCGLGNREMGIAEALEKRGLLEWADGRVFTLAPLGRAVAVHLESETT